MNLIVKFVCSLEARERALARSLVPGRADRRLVFRGDVIARVCAVRITEWVQRNNAVCLFRARASERQCWWLSQQLLCVV